MKKPVIPYSRDGAEQEADPPTFIINKIPLKTLHSNFQVLIIFHKPVQHKSSDKLNTGMID